LRKIKKISNYSDYTDADYRGRSLAYNNIVSSKYRK